MEFDTQSYHFILLVQLGTLAKELTTYHKRSASKVLVIGGKRSIYSPFLLSVNKPLSRLENHTYLAYIEDMRI